MPVEGAGRPGALRRRLARFLLGLTLGSATALGFGYWAVESYVEGESLSTLLSGELDRREAEGSPSSPGEPGDAIRYFRSDDGLSLPPELAALGPGAYDEVELQQHAYRVLVRDLGVRGRAYLLNDIGPLATRERQLLLLLVIGVLAIGGVAWSASARLASIALAPLDRLGRAIRSLDPARRDARLALEQDQELRGIGLVFNEHLAALDRMTERELAFAASVSHELRTHLAVIENTLELVGVKTTGASAGLARGARASRRAREDLEALLAMTRPQPVDIAPVALGPLLQQVAADVAAGTADLPAIEWTFADDGGETVTSARTLAIVFANLLRNAILAAGAEGHIRVSVHAGGFSIGDDGPGFPEGDWSRLFEPWFEGRNGGSGLGLFIAHTLLRRLGGELGFAAVTPHGLVASVQLTRPAAENLHHLAESDGARPANC